MPTIKCYDKYGIELDHLTQWDINVSLKIHDFPYEIAPVCHFASRFDKTAKTVTSTLSDKTVSVQVPNILLTENKPIKVFVFLYDSEEDTGRTIYTIDLPVSAKPKPDDYEYSDNIEIIEITALKVRLEALIAQAEETVNTRIDELENTYQNIITEIKEGIADDVNNLNTQITNANTNLIREIRDNNSQLSSDIQSAKNSLNSEIEQALNTLVSGIRDGSPRGYFSNIDELEEMPAGIYLYINPESEDNGYIYYWSGTELSSKLLYYAGIIINNGSITLDKFSDGLKKQCLGKIVPYVLLAEEWSANKQQVDVNNYYTVTEHTRVDIDLGTEANEQLRNDDCAAIYIVNDDGELWAHYLGNTPTQDIEVQLTIKETV